MKKNKGIVLILICLITCFVTACHSFDADGYVKALLDNTYKGDSSSLVRFSKSNKEDMNQIYQDSIAKTCEVLLSNEKVSDTLQESYKSFVTDMMQKAEYKVGSAIKNDDDSFTVTVMTHQLCLSANDEINDKTDSYINELQESVNNGDTTITDSELKEQTYTILLECYTKALENAVYSENAVEHSVHVTLSGNTYQADESDLSEIAQDLFLIQ